MCLAALGSCFGSCLASCCCSSCKDCQSKHGPTSRLPYIFLMFLCCIFAIVMSLYGEKELWNSSLLNASFSVCESESCKGDGSVYRTSFTLFVFFIIHAFIVYFVMSFHWLFFVWKLLILIAFLTATFFMSGSFFVGYSNFARVASVVYLILQIIVLLTWALDLNDLLVGKINDLQNKDVETETNCSLTGYKCLIITATLILYASIITLLVFFFQWFYPDPSCTFNQAIIAITIVLIIIATILPLVLASGSIFATGVISFYMTYLCFAGLASYPKTECNKFANDKNTASLWIGIIITAIAICYTAFSVSNQSIFTGNQNVQPKTENSAQNDDEANKEINESNYNDVDDKPDTALVVTDEELKNRLDQKQNVLFHLCMAFSALYMCMLYTNWGTNTNSNDTAVGRGKISVWVNIGAQWFAFALYVWTIVAPKACPQRFGQVSDDE